MSAPLLSLMPEVIVLIGLQGAGKSTFRAQRFDTTHVVVSKDRFRNNRRPERRQQRLMGEALAAGRSVIVDNTNPSLAERSTILALARTLNARIVGYFFSSPLQECLVRNAARPVKAQVPEVGILATARRLVPPSPSEGFDQLWLVRTREDFTFEITPYEETTNEPR
jgi:predicted kinase